MSVMSNSDFLRRRIVPAATVNSADEGKALAEAMLAGGMDVIEITFRTDAAAAAIKAIADAFPEMAVGAGTILSKDQLDAAIDAGSTYAVAPGLNPDVVGYAQERGIMLVPGTITPTEIDLAIRLDCRYLKFFPAEASGGIKMLKALAGPYAHTGVQFLPTGGIGVGNATDYLGLDVVAAVGGSWMVSPALVRDGQWAEITKLCKEAVALGAGS